MPNIAASLFSITNSSPIQGWMSQASEDEGRGVLIKAKERKKRTHKISVSSMLKMLALWIAELTDMDTL